MSARQDPRRNRAESAHALAEPDPVRPSSGAAAIVYRAGDEHWWLWWRCPTCRWFALPLRNGWESACVDGLADVHCPGCETRRRRVEAAGDCPVVWYDTLARDWVLRLPGPPPGVEPGARAGSKTYAGPGPGMDAILPLGLRWYDTPWAEIVRTAADLAFAGDAFAGP
jgi:hypothetical protein